MIDVLNVLEEIYGWAYKFVFLAKLATILIALDYLSHESDLLGIIQHVFLIYAGSIEP